MAIKLGGRAVGSKSILSGVEDCVTALRLCDVEVQRRVRAAVEVTTAAAAARARAKVAVSGPNSRKAKGRLGPGELRDTIRAEMSTGDAPVGYVRAGYGKLKRRTRALTEKGKARAARRRKAAGPQRDAGIYAMVVEFGGPHEPAQPYMRPAVDEERGPHYARLRVALADAVQAASQ